MRHYTGSVSFDATGAFLAVSSPRGHVVTLWDADAGEFRNAIEAVDASGVAPTGNEAEFLVTGGDGVLRLVDARDGATKVFPATHDALQWDNHMGRADGS